MPKYQRLEDRQPFYSHVLSEAQRLPGVTGASYISFLPMVMRGGIWPVDIKSRPQDSANRQTASLRFVTPGFFAVMGIPMRLGRDIAESDAHDAPWVAVVSESFVRRYWPGENPIGKRFKGQDQRGKNDDWDTVIGLVRNLRRQGVEKEPTPHIFEWSKQSGDKTSTFIARTNTDPLRLASDLRSIVRDVSSNSVISKISTLDDEIGDQIKQRRFQTWVLGMFSMVALLLSTIGIFGIMHYSVTQRTQEVGIRMALGAQSQDVLRLILTQGLVLTAIGVAIGLGGAFLLTRLMVSLLYGTSATDPITFLSGTAILILVSFIASYLPARRATKVDPMMALRYD